MMTETACQKWRYNNKNEEGQSRSQEEKYFLIAQSSTVHNGKVYYLWVANNLHKLAIILLLRKTPLANISIKTQSI